MSLLKIKILDKSMVEKYEDYIINRNMADSGFDLFIPDAHVIQRLRTSNVIDHKVQIEFTKDVPEKKMNGNITLTSINSHILMLPRSSISKTALRLANSVGNIDAQYRGNIIAKVDNLGAEIEVKKGTSLFQLLIGEYCEIQIVNELSETRRGKDGFGSTGNTQV